MNQVLSTLAIIGMLALAGSVPAEAISEHDRQGPGKVVGLLQLQGSLGDVDEVLGTANIRIYTTDLDLVASGRTKEVVLGEAFFAIDGLPIEAQRDMLMFLVEEHMCRDILETIERIGKFEKNPGTGIAFQLDVEDVVGVKRQVNKLSEKVEKEI